MVNINKEILEKYGIYETRSLKENEEAKLLKMKKEIENVINTSIERLYLIGESAWGKDAENETYTICILVDKRYKDLNVIKEALEKYCILHEITAVIWTLCQFEKRKNAPTEDDYYIERYGIKVYDSGNSPNVNENIKYTKYAETMRNYKTICKYALKTTDYMMASLVQIYTLKIGYSSIGRDIDLKRDCEFAKLVSNDQNVTKLIDGYLKETENDIKIKIVKEFEKYLDTVKQVKFPMKLEEKPTMDVYGKLLKEKEKNGTLDIKSLTREDLYIMYLIQDIDTHKIANLYEVEDRKISAKRDKWGIKLREKGLIDKENIIGDVIEKQNETGYKYTYALLKKIGILSFEDCALLILEYMTDGSVYLLREFWQFTNSKQEKIDEIISNRENSHYYKASLCMDLFLQNELIEEMDFKQYRITRKGKDLVKYCYRKDINYINIPVIYQYFKNVNYYDLYFADDCVENYEEYSMDFEEIDLKQYDVVDSELNAQKDNDNIDIEKQVLNLKRIEYKKDNELKSKVNRKKLDIKPIKKNFIKLNEIKTEFGKKCEEIVYRYEIERLKKEGREDKSKEVVWSSKEEGDGLGYDIKSFENVNGNYEEIYIEVKGTNKKVTEPFDITINEVIFSEKNKDHYYIYRIGKANTESPEVCIIKGSVFDNFDLEAIKYRATRR